MTLSTQVGNTVKYAFVCNRPFRNLTISLHDVINEHVFIIYLVIQ